MSLKHILKKAVGAFVRSKTRGRRTPTHSRPVSGHQSAEAQMAKGAAKSAKKKL